MSRRPSGLAIAPPPLAPRRASLLSLDTAASPHTPRSCTSALPPPDLYLQPPVSKRTSTTSWSSSNADEMDFDWKQEQVLLLSRTLDALPAHLVTPFNGPIPPSNLLDKIARGVSQAKGPLDWPHSIRATRVKLIELARTRAKDDAKKKEQPQLIPKVVDVQSSSHYDYFDDHHSHINADDVPQRRPLYKQSSMDFITPANTEIKDNPTIAQLSNRLQRTDRSFPNPATYHPYKAPSRIAVRSRTANISQAPASRSPSPPAASDVPDLIVPNPNSLSNSSSNSSFDSVPPPSAFRPQFMRRSASSTLSVSSMYSNSSNGSGMALQDKRLQRVRRSDSFCAAPVNPPAPPPKDYPHKQPIVGMKRAPSYGALAQGVRQEGKLKSERQVQENAFLKAMKDVIEQEDGKNPSSPKKRDTGNDKENEQQKHGRQLSGSYPSSDEEEKARSKRAKKPRSGAAVANAPNTPTNTRGPAGSPGGVVPPSPSVASLSSSTSAESLSTSGRATPMVVTAPSTPRGAPAPPAKDRFLTSPRTPPSKVSSSSKPRTMLKAAATLLVGSPERAKSPAAGEARGKATNANANANGSKARVRAPKPYLYGVAEDKDKGAACIANNTTANSNNSNNSNNTAPPANKRPTAPKMNAQRNPSMFGMELPRLSAPAITTAAAAPSALSKPQHRRTLSRESTTTNTTTTSSVSAKGGLLPLCGDAALSVPPSPLTQGFAQDAAAARRHVKRPSGGPSAHTALSASASTGPFPSTSSATRALSPAPALTLTSITSITSIASITGSPEPPASPRVKTLRRVRNRLALAPARRISFGSLLESTAEAEDAAAMEVDSMGDADDRSLDLSKGRLGRGLGSAFGSAVSGLGSSALGSSALGSSALGSSALGLGAPWKEETPSVFGAVLGEAFSVKPRAVPEKTSRTVVRDRERERERQKEKEKEQVGERRAKDKERSLKEGTLGSAFRMA